MIRRRRFLIAAGALLAVPLRATAQGAAKPRRVGLLFASSEKAAGQGIEKFVARLRELGHVPGKTVVIIPRFAESDAGRLPALAKELLDENVDVIWAPSTAAALAVQGLSSRVPIVFQDYDPVASGLVSSLARPGRNATGLTLGGTIIAAKRVELLKDCFPSIAKLGVVHDPQWITKPELGHVAEAARGFGMRIERAEATTLAQHLDAVARLQAAGIDAYYVVWTGSSYAMRRDLCAAIRATRLPAVYGTGAFCDAGGLIAYSLLTSDFIAKSAEYVDRILRGASPADPPVQEPTVFELIVNLATARAQGLRIPPATLLRATQVIE